MSITFRPAKRENVPLLIGIAGGTGSGKTMSALRLATGLSGGERFGIVDTENGRALHYADQFDFDHAELHAPFRPERYVEAITTAAEKYGVVVVDSFSHEYTGDGGLLDWHEEELTRMAGDDWKKREAMTFAAWVKPKREHKRLVTKLLQLRAHLIVCLRAEEKIEIVKRNGKTEVVPKKTLAGHVGWIPLTEKSFPYELTTSLVLTPDEPGLPKPIKLQEQHRPFFPLDQPISEESGRRLAEWACGDAATPSATAPGLTVAELNAKREQAGIGDDLFRETGRTLFPGKAPADLTDADRAALWIELEKASASPEESGQAAESETRSPSQSQEPPQASAAEPAGFAPPASVDPENPDVVAANEAAELTFESGKYAGKTLREVADDGDDGASYVRWVIRNWKTEGFRLKVEAFARVYLPDVYEEIEAQRLAASA